MAGGIEQFAEQLRALKDRSGLSYGALAKRLHMSTSTVHRYCNGGAVPAEYAPVERFARLCRATPQELVELHRRWILADDARRWKGQGEAGAKTPEPAVAEPVKPMAEPMPASAGPEPAAESAPEPQPRSEPESGAAPQPLPRPLSGEPAPAAAGRRSRRMRLGVVVAAAAVGIAVPTALVAWAATAPTSTYHDDTHAHRARSNVSGAPLASSGAPGSTGPDRGGATPPDGRAPAGGTGKAEGGGKKTDGNSDAPDQRISGGKDERGGSGSDTGEPLTADVQPYTLADRCDTMYVSGRTPAEVPEPPYDGDARAWVTGLRAVTGGRMHITVDVQGRNGQAVVLRALHVRVVKSTAPLAWSGYSMGDGCGGGLTPAFFDIDLDRDRPAPRATAGLQGDIKIPATDFPYKVSSTDPQPLDIVARTTGHDVTWYLELEWSSGGRSGTLKIDDHGQPFRTTAVKDRPQYTWRADQKKWEPLSDYARR
ncbi:helix-turn-helix domain-containing protein [Streptomyces sp. ET3-23]|uniref:helix-turn-helix domain-containing protein n=1 Tax=Streptomyces sp. ET3-23 TaxID=2885643 RepID=UPI001D0FC9FF|nr:helix-turn-helix transcriptional regulator [Streptomyces sp. ET3-23]MCC2280168.1 helix-turn-helix domain-containing protein [Streptomyces sp. ET3-23]